MTYALFLLLFVISPAAVLGIGLRRHLDRKYWAMIGLVVLIALAYTTPWDNYLVASGVWRYDPRLVTGLVIGWVPVEEYSFFVLQTIFTGLLLRAVLLAVEKRAPETAAAPEPPAEAGLRMPTTE